MSTDIQIKRGSNKNKNEYCSGYIDVYCGDYCHRIPDVRIGKEAIETYERISDTLDWVENDRIKLFIFIFMVLDTDIEKILNYIFSGKFLKNKIYCNMFNAGGMNTLPVIDWP